MKDELALEKGQYHLSRSEKMYLLRRNFRRLLEIAAILFWFLLLIGLIIIGAATVLLSDSGLGQTITLCIIFVTPVLIILKAWGKPLLELLKMKWWISEKDIEVTSVSGHFGERVHTTQHLDNFFNIDNALIDFPKQWLDNLSNVSTTTSGRNPNHFTFRVAKVSKSGNRIIRFKMFSREGATRHDNADRGDMVIGDFKYIVLQTETSGIDEDYRHRVPINRNHDSLPKVGLSMIILSVFLVLACFISFENRQTDIDAAENKMIKAAALIGIADDIDERQLVDRDLPQMSFEPEYGKRVLSGEAFKYVTVSRNDTEKVPFILSRNEYTLVSGVSNLSPSVSVGYQNKVKRKDIIAYRKRLIKYTNSLKSVPETVRKRFSERLKNMDDNLIARQVRSYGNRFVSDTLFVNALLPTPEIYPVRPIYRLQMCIGRVALCPVTSARIEPNTLDLFILTASNNRFQVSSYNALKSLTETTQQFDNLRLSKPNYWLLLITAVVLGGGILLKTLFWLARKTQRLYTRLGRQES